MRSLLTVVSCGCTHKLRTLKTDIILNQQVCENHNISQSINRQTLNMSKHVTFNKLVMVVPHEHINNFSDQEIRDSWYNKRELDQIKTDIIDTVQNKMATRGSHYDETGESSYCTRGLEYRTRLGMEQRKNTRCNAWDAVLDEQDRQWCNGEYNDERLAQVYMACTRKSVRVALLLARQDKLAVYGNAKSSIKSDQEFYNKETIGTRPGKIVVRKVCSPAA